MKSFFVGRNYFSSYKKKKVKITLKSLNLGDTHEKQWILCVRERVLSEYNGTKIYARLIFSN